MTGQRAPVPVARLGTALAARALPSRPDRERYAAEFLAELYDLTPAAQLRHTAGILSQAFALRAALGSSPSRIEEKVMPTSPLGRRILCRLRWHHWHTYSTEDGGLYKACTVCHKDHPGKLGMDNTIGA